MSLKKCVDNIGVSKREVRLYKIPPILDTLQLMIRFLKNFIWLLCGGKLSE